MAGPRVRGCAAAANSSSSLSDVPRYLPCSPWILLPRYALIFHSYKSQGCTPQDMEFAHGDAVQPKRGCCGWAGPTAGVTIPDFRCDTRKAFPGASVSPPA